MTTSILYSVGEGKDLLGLWKHRCNTLYLWEKDRGVSTEDDLVPRTLDVSEPRFSSHMTCQSLAVIRRDRYSEKILITKAQAHRVRLRQVLYWQRQTSSTSIKIKTQISLQ